MKFFSALLNLGFGLGIYYLSWDYFETLAIEMQASALALFSLLLLGFLIIPILIAISLHFIQVSVYMLYQTNRTLAYILLGIVLTMTIYFGFLGLSEFPRTAFKTEPVFTSFVILSLITGLSFGLISLRALQDSAKTERKNSL